MSADLPVVFLVEDEETFIEALEIGLKREGFACMLLAMVLKHWPCLKA